MQHLTLKAVTTATTTTTLVVTLTAVNDTPTVTAPASFAVTEDVADSLGLARNRGELVQTVQPAQAAAAAGLQSGDVVVKVDNKEVAPDNTLSFIVANTAPGKRIPIEAIRNGKRMTLTAAVGKRPSEEELAKQTFGPATPDADDRFNRTPEKQGEGLAERSLGLSVLPMTPQIAGQIGLPTDTRGLVISVVDGSSDAGAKGLQRGDIVLAVNEQKIAYEVDLKRLKVQLTSLNIQADTIKILEDQKNALFRNYDNALTRYGVDSLDAASRVDRQVQGEDVLTFRTLENLDQDLSTRVKKSFDLLRLEIDKCSKE